MENNSFSEEVIEENVGQTAQPRPLDVRESEVVSGSLPPAEESKEDLINEDVQNAPPVENNQSSGEVIE